MPRHYTPKVDCVCLQCGVAFQRCPAEVRRKGAKYCSHDCAHAAQRGQRTHAWKGGRTLKNGYVYLYLPDHPHAIKKGYVAEHRVVAEKHLGRYLDPSEIVHHFSGDKTDNRWENLCVMTHAQHMTIYHGAAGGWSRDYEACIVCGKTDSPYNSRGVCARCNMRSRYVKASERKAKAPL